MMADSSRQSPVHAQPGTIDAADRSVATLELIRREYRCRRILVGEAARAAVELLASGDPDTRLAATSLLLELGQIDPLEPSVRLGVERLLAEDERADTKTNEPWCVGDRLLFARVMLCAHRPAEAARELERVLEIDPDNPVGRTLLVRVKQMEGRLSEAIRVWETLPDATERQSALIELGILYQASQQPERTGSHRIGHDTHPSRTAAHLGLERAFRYASAGEIGVATELCERVMAQHRATDRATYKLAAIEKAWLMEAAGRVEEAIAFLEALGREADLTADADRLVSLGRLYESRADTLRKAIDTYEVLFEKTSEITYLSRLGKIYARIGDRARAEMYRRRHLAAFEQDAGDLRLEQLLRVASLRHIPLDDLERISFPIAKLVAQGERFRGLETVTARRKRAILAILRKDFATARDIFLRLRESGGAAACDWLYLAELERKGGNRTDAIDCYWSSIVHTDAGSLPTQPMAIAGLLACSEPNSGEVPASLRAILSDSYRLARASDAIADLAKLRRLDPLPWRALANLAGWSGRSEEAERHARRAQFLEKEAARSLAMPGHALTAAVYHARGERRGIVHELWAMRYRASGTEAGRLADDRVFANLTEDLRTYLSSVFEATKAYAKTKFCHLVHDIDDYAYQFKLTNEDEPSSGPSAGLAIAIAFMSVFLNRPVPEGIALSGVLVSEARDHLSVRRIGDADIKVQGAIARRLSRIVLPGETRREVEASDLVPREASSRVVRYVDSLDEALEAVFGDEIWLY